MVFGNKNGNVIKILSNQNMSTNDHTDILDKFKDDHLFFSIISLKCKY